MRKHLIRVVAPVFVIGALVGIVAAPSEAMKDTNWPCAACITTHR